MAEIEEVNALFGLTNLEHGPRTEAEKKDSKLAAFRFAPDEYLPTIPPVREGRRRRKKRKRDHDNESSGMDERHVPPPPPSRNGSSSSSFNTSKSTNNQTGHSAGNSRSTVKF